MDSISNGMSVGAFIGFFILTLDKYIPRFPTEFAFLSVGFLVFMIWIADNTTINWERICNENSHQYTVVHYSVDNVSFANNASFSGPGDH